ncbi:hsp70-like protein [Cercophora samala]|uniref:Hsp70-like protein n=1 Tax=Cercophora samala TaxID=330535 RepID=A0AA39ZCL7_9PEZI|nr:hsp70-like protein [Cercophora samala]
MSSTNSRFKGFPGFGKRKSSGPPQQNGQNGRASPHIPQTQTPPLGAPQIPTLFPSRPGPPAPSIASNSSQQSLPMNHPGPGPRPPSYSAQNYPPGPPGPVGRTSPLANQGPARTPPSQMVGGPPPINTGGPPVAGYPPPVMGGGPPPPPGYGNPTGYPPPPPQPTGPVAPYQRNAAAEVEGNSRSKAQLIVGIDFGTTFSGVAFAFATNNEAKEDIITEWPGAGSYTKQKIPTVLYYDQYQKVVGWGPDIADALAPTGYPKPGVQKVEWFKLQLMLSGNTYIDPINLPPLPPGKSEIDVAADYLFKLRQAMRAALQKTLGEVFNREERNIRYYLTVPAIWNDAGKAATRAAAIQAGFLRDENDNRLTLVSEPEAAALFCSKTGLLNLKVHDAVLIVDCGGGTVDLIAYEVEDENPFTVAECTAGSGDSCGSTALNRNFSNILRTKIRKMKLPDGSKTAGRVYAKCIMDFENRIKADFRNNGQKWAVDVGIEAEFPEAGIEEGYMTFTNEEILQCFEPVVNRILELVRNQIIAIQAQNRTLQNILVVGGFGASEYLFQQIKLHVPPQFQSKVVRPMDSVAAIVKGAVTAGITERVITHRVARRHYLMATLQPFKEGYHPEAYRVPSLDGKDRCKFTRQIFVQKGQKVKIGEPVKVSFFRQVAPGATLMYEDILYACDDDVCPEYTKDPRIKEVVTLTSDLSRKNLEKDFERMDTPQGTFYRVYFDIYLTLDGSEFSAELVYEHEVLQHRTVRFRKTTPGLGTTQEREWGFVARFMKEGTRQHASTSVVDPTPSPSRKRKHRGQRLKRLMLAPLTLFGGRASAEVITVTVYGGPGNLSGPPGPTSLNNTVTTTSAAIASSAQVTELDPNSPTPIPLLVTNNCAETIWPGIGTQNGIGPGTGGFELAPGASKQMYVINGAGAACLTGDCFAQLDCQFTVSPPLPPFSLYRSNTPSQGAVPVTLAEFNLIGGMDGKQTFYDISLVDGYNIPLAIIYIPARNTSWIPPNLTNAACIASSGYLTEPSSTGTFFSNASFPIPLETVQTNPTVARWCPWDLQKYPPSKPGSGIYPYPDDKIERPVFDPCLSACSKTNAPQDCCTGEYNGPEVCRPSLYSEMAKAVCPDAYSYAFDDQTSTFIIPAGGGWEVRFCPVGRSTNILEVFGKELRSLASGGWHPDKGVVERVRERVGNKSYIESVNPVRAVGGRLKVEGWVLVVVGLGVVVGGMVF